MKRTNLIWLSLLALILTACQDENFGYTKSEIYQSYIDRKYAEEFAKAFPNVDPNHTWMCTPDTIYNEVEVPGMTRAAGDAPQSVVRKRENSAVVYASMNYLDVSKVLDYMVEGEDNHSNKKATLDFEYKAIKDNGDGYQEYTITPTFWGRKFTDHNAVGIYYIKADGTKVDMGTFWNDNNDKRDLYVVYKDGHKELITPTDQQITDDPYWANPSHNTATDPNVSYLKLSHPCNECGLEFYVKDNGSNNIYGGQNSNLHFESDGMQNSGWQCIKVEDATDGKNNGNTWDTQFFVTTPNKEWQPGETYEFYMRYTTSSYQTNSVDVQYHTTAGNYINGGNGPSVTFNKGDGWQELRFTGTIPNEIYGVKTLAFNLNVDYKTLYHFRDITWRSTSKSCKNNDCENGRIAVDHYDLPQYTLKVPVGTKWGVYLETQKQQTNDKSTIRYYSNSDFNKLTENNQQPGLKAAATFSYDETTYVSFEDAPTMCTGGFTGDCNTCGRGHYDHDYNDIVLTISPRPVTNAYRSISYRVMCEDLGGTFDWDFNDVVFDVLYNDGTDDTNNKANIKILLQAVGGTLPIYMNYDGERLMENGKSELHEWSTGQTKNNKDLYSPVNVENCADVKKTGPVVLKTIWFNNQREENLDLCDYVHKILIEVDQKNGSTTTVKFPEFKGDATPQCFMTQTTVSWADELQPIYEKYDDFKSWVSSFQTAPDWWREDR